MANLSLSCVTPWCNGNTAPFGGVIHGSNPCGVATVQQLKIYLVAMAMKAVFADRNPHLGDPAFGEVPAGLDDE